MTASHVKRFHARTSREALRLVREALGDDAVILSTTPAGGGVEVLAMTPEAMREAEQSPRPTAGIAEVATRAAAVSSGLGASNADDDAARLEMSTLSFQDYVRRRMLKRRQAALGDDARRQATAHDAAPPSRLDVRVGDDETPGERTLSPTEIYAAASASAEQARVMREQQARAEREHAFVAAQARAVAEPPLAADPIRYGAAPAAESLAAVDGERAGELLAEMRSMKGLLEERFGALAFMEKLQRRPAEARLTQKLLDCGLSPALARKLAEGLPHDVADEQSWASQVLERNLRAGGTETAIETRGGVYALVGATGVGKTTTTAKIAAAFAARHGAASLGLVTLDAYRVGAQEQLRAYGRILGVPVHTAHDRASLEDLLELLSAKKLVLIDTAGMAQRDARTREMLDMVSHASIRKVVVVSAAAQGETIEDVVSAYHAAASHGIVLSKIDEAVKLGPALDAAIRHKLAIVGVGNGQRVPEDWHQLSARSLVHRALRGGGSSAWRFDASDMNLLFTLPHGGASASTAAVAA